MTTKGFSYAQAGVDIDAGNALVEAIKPLAKATRRTGADAGLGGFGALFDMAAIGYKDPLLVATTDGVGTKLKLALTVGKHDTIGIDLVAMCVNDLIVQGAEPLFFLDYFATGKLQVARGKDIITGIAAGCSQAGCALIGGETAEMPGMYHGEDYDLAGFSVGVVERSQVLPANVGAGDVVLGLASSGVHSNGFSLVRYILDQKGHRYDQPAPFAAGKTIGEALLTPTRIYVKPLLAALKTGGIHAMAHITGGGLLENIPRVLPNHLAVTIARNAWKFSDVFAWLQQEGAVAEEEMLRTFNCGVGMVIISAKDKADNLTSQLQQAGETVYRLGEVIARSGDSTPQVQIG